MRSVWRTEVAEDVREAAAIGVAMAVVGASFGAVAEAKGVSLLLIMAMSLLVFAGSAQFLAVGVMAAGGAPIAAVLGGLLVNARHLPYGLAVGDAVGRSWPRRLLGTHLMVDQAVATATSRTDPKRARRAYWLVGGTLFVLWNVGTLLGAVAGGAVPDPDRLGVDAAFPAALLAMILPALRAAGDARRVALLGSVLALLATPWLPPGLPVLIALFGLAVAGRPARAGA
ncbi:AzlC family ABC transporter permease [Pseudonocardia eucalypti]|uniref:AzlC family ABC transporter permease n=1 Tax=Pseudonocardia eucalypti TaxID=648755 RepID=A0ABP9QSS5_9PSEU